MLKTKVYLSSVTNLSDARYAAGMGVNYVGFNINPESDCFVTPEQVKTISEWVSGVGLVGEIDNNTGSEIKNYPLENVQINNYDLVNGFDEPILKIRIDEGNIDDLNNILEAYMNKVSFFVLEVVHENLANWHRLLNDYCREYPIYIDTAFNDAILALVVEKIQPSGIVLYGSNEEKPGLSNYDGIADMLEQLEIE